MTRDDFMEFFRNTEKLNTLSTDDRVEIFETVLTGSSDLTVERISSVLQDYNVENVVATDVSDKLEINTPKGPRWINLDDVFFHQKFYGLLSRGYSSQEAKQIMEREE